MPKNSSPRSKQWERDRRERLNNVFHKLRTLLPCYDPSISLPKVEILERAIKYIDELQNDNQDLLEKNLEYVHAKQLKSLRQRIDNFIVRAELLTKLLKDANIAIPQEPFAVSEALPKQPFKWKNKIKYVNINVNSNLGIAKNQKPKKRKRKSQLGQNKKENKVPSFNESNNIGSEKNPAATTNVVPEIINEIRNSDITEQPSIKKAPSKTNSPKNVIQTAQLQTTCSSNVAARKDPGFSIQKKSTNTTTACFNQPITTIKTNISISGLQTCPPRAVIAGPGLCPGTLILANGNIVPVLPPPVLPSPMLAASTQFIVNTPACNSVAALPASQILMMQKKLSFTTSGSVSAVSRLHPPLISKPLRKTKDSTITTYVNKLPIPALSVCKQKPLQLLSFIANIGPNQNIKSKSKYKPNKTACQNPKAINASIKSKTPSLLNKNSAQPKKKIKFSQLMIHKTATSEHSKKKTSVPVADKTANSKPNKVLCQQHKGLKIVGNKEQQRIYGAINKHKKDQETSSTVSEDKKDTETSSTINDNEGVEITSTVDKDKRKLEISPASNQGKTNEKTAVTVSNKDKKDVETLAASENKSNKKTSKLINEDNIDKESSTLIDEDKKDTETSAISNESNKNMETSAENLKRTSDECGNEDKSDKFKRLKCMTEAINTDSESQSNVIKTGTSKLNIQCTYTIDALCNTGLQKEVKSHDEKNKTCIKEPSSKTNSLDNTSTDCAQNIDEEKISKSGKYLKENKSCNTISNVKSHTLSSDNSEFLNESIDNAITSRNMTDNECIDIHQENTNFPCLLSETVKASTSAVHHRCETGVFKQKNSDNNQTVLVDNSSSTNDTNTTVEVHPSNTCTASSTDNFTLNNIDDESKNVLSPDFQGHEFSGDLFASLQVPTESHHPESISPTAAFLLAFPLVSTSKVSDVIDSQEDTGSDSLQESSTLLQIGDIEQDKTTVAKVHETEVYSNSATESIGIFQNSKKESRAFSQAMLNSETCITKDTKDEQNISEDFQKIDCVLPDVTIPCNTSTLHHPQTRSIGTQFHSDNTDGLNLNFTTTSIQSERGFENKYVCESLESKSMHHTDLFTETHSTSSQSLCQPKIHVTAANSAPCVVEMSHNNHANEKPPRDFTKPVLPFELNSSENQKQAVIEKNFNNFNVKQYSLSNQKETNLEASSTEKKKNSVTFETKENNTQIDSIRTNDSCNFKMELTSNAFVSVGSNIQFTTSASYIRHPATYSQAPLKHESQQTGCVPISMSNNISHLGISSWSTLSPVTNAGNSGTPNFHQPTIEYSNITENTRGMSSELSGKLFAHPSTKESDGKHYRNVIQKENNPVKQFSIGEFSGSFSGSIVPSNNSSVTVCNTNPCFTQTALKTSQATVKFSSDTQKIPVNWMTTSHKNINKKTENYNKDKHFTNIFSGTSTSSTPVYESRNYADSSFFNSHISAHASVYGYQDVNSLHLRHTEPILHGCGSYSTSVMTTQNVMAEKNNFTENSEISAPWQRKETFSSDLNNSICIPSTLPTLTGDLALGTMTMSDANNVQKCIPNSYCEISEKSKKVSSSVQFKSNSPGTSGKDMKNKNKNKSNINNLTCSQDFINGSGMGFLSVSQLVDSEKSELLPELNVTDSKKNSRQFDTQVKGIENRNTLSKPSISNNSPDEKVGSNLKASHIQQVPTNDRKKDVSSESLNSKQFVPKSTSWSQENFVASSAASTNLTTPQNMVSSNKKEHVHSKPFLPASNSTTWQNSTYSCPVGSNLTISHDLTEINGHKGTQSLVSKNIFVSTSSPWSGDSYLTTASNITVPSVVTSENRKKYDPLKDLNPEPFYPVSNAAMWSVDSYTAAHSSDLTMPETGTVNSFKNGTNSSQNLNPRHFFPTSFSSSWSGDTYSAGTSALPVSVVTCSTSTLPILQTYTKTSKKQQNESSPNLNPKSKSSVSSSWTKSNYSTVPNIMAPQVPSKSNDDALPVLNSKQFFHVPVTSTWSSISYNSPHSSHLEKENTRKTNESQNLNSHFSPATSSWIKNSYVSTSSSTSVVSHNAPGDNRRKNCVSQNINSKSCLPKSVAATWPDNSYSLTSVSMSTSQITSGENKKSSSTNDINSKYCLTTSEPNNWSNELDFNGTKHSNAEVCYKTPASNYSAEALIGINVSKAGTHDSCQRMLSLPPPVVSDRFGHQQSYIKHAPGPGALSVPPSFGGGYINRAAVPTINQTQEINGSNIFLPSQPSSFNQPPYSFSSYCYSAASTITVVSYQQSNSAHYSSVNFINTPFSSTDVPVSLGTGFHQNITASNNLSSSILSSESSIPTSLSKTISVSKESLQKSNHQNSTQATVTLSSAHSSHNSLPYGSLISTGNLPSSAENVTVSCTNDFSQGNLQSNNSMQANINIFQQGKQRTKKRTQASSTMVSAGITPTTDFTSYFSVPPGLNSPLLADDGLFSGNFIPPQPTLYPPTGPRPNFSSCPPAASRNLPHIGGSFPSGSTVANFNLSTIFPEINDKVSSTFPNVNKSSAHTTSRSYSNFTGSFVDTPHSDQLSAQSVSNTSKYPSPASRMTGMQWL